jgi:hypothetical protein
MLDHKIRTTMSSLWVQTATLAAIGAAALALLAAPPASAQPKGGTASKGCPVEDENGNVTYVPEGTTYLLFHCGADGEWHFGWATTNLQKPPTSGGGSGVPANGVGAVNVRTVRKFSPGPAALSARSQASARQIVDESRCVEGTWGKDHWGKIYHCEGGGWVLYSMPASAVRGVAERTVVPVSAAKL